MSYNNKNKTIDNESIIVCASAGTGKTKMLVNRFIDLIKSGKAAFDQIIAITFTEKAAMEMKERLYTEICREKIYKNNLRALHQAIFNSYISTVHSFCTRIIQENIDETPLPYNHTIIDEAEENILRERFINRFLNKHIENDSIELKFLLTYLSIYEVKKLLFNSWEKYFLIKKYGNKLINKKAYYSIIKESVKSLINSYLNDKRIKYLINALITYKNQFVDNQLVFLDNFKSNNVDEKDFISLFSINARRLKNFNSELFQLFQELKKEYSGEIKFLKNLSLSDIDNKFIEVNNYAFNLINEYLDKYRQELDLNGLLDFTRMELYTIEFLNSKSERAKLFSKRFKFLLVDEFQDINPVQYEIIQAIINNNPEINIFFVGDEKQSIYRFRGAEVEIMNQQKDRMKTLELLTNYRSIEKLVNFQNIIFPKLFNSSKSVFPFEATYPSTPIKAHTKFEIVNNPIEIIILRENEKPSEDSIDYIQLEAFLIANRIKEMVNNHTIYRVKVGNFDKIKYNDIAILIRAYTHQEKYERALRQLDIPYHTCTGFGFYELNEIKNLINFIRALINFYDEPALIGTIRSSMIGVSDDALIELSTAGSLFDGLYKYFYENKKFNLTDEDAYKLEFFKNLYTKLQPLLNQEDVITLLEKIIDETDYLSILANLKDGQRKVANVKKLLNLAREWYSNTGLSPIDFIRKINIYKKMNVKEGEALQESTNEDSVKIMTIHSSKGLDFSVVIIPLSYSLSTSSQPFFIDKNTGTVLNIKDKATESEPVIVKIQKKFEQLKDIAEEKRIFYVALTRASSYLIITGIEKEKARYNTNWKFLKQILQDDETKIPAKITVVSPDDVIVEEKAKKYEEINLNSYKTVSFLRDEINKIKKRISLIEKKVLRITPTEYSDKIVSGITPYSEITDYTSLKPTELGNLVHRALSWWDYQKLDDIKKYIVELVSLQDLSRDEKLKIIDDIYKWVENLASFKNPIYKLILNAQEIKKEVDVMGYINGIFIEGTIDLLLKNKQSYFIIDYKTDHKEMSENEEVIEKYKAQLDLYATLLYKCYNLPVKKHFIYFLRNGKIVETTIDNYLVLSVMENLKNISP